MCRLLTALLGLFALGAAPAATDFHAKFEGKVYSYEFSWPRQAAAVPPLRARLVSQMNDSRSELIAMATAAHEESVRDGGWFPDVGYDLTVSWTLAGQSPRLLSLSGSHYVFTGGAHGLPSSDAILWDKSSNQALAVRELFEPSARLLMLRPRYCAALDRERMKRREGEKLDMFSDCPPFSDLTIVPADTNRNGRFDRLEIIADPYVAGPYAEGFYTVDLTLDARTLAALKPEYRDSFELQPQ